MTRSSDRNPRTGEPWLPDFCQLPTLFTALAAAEIVALVLGLAPRSGPEWTLFEWLAASFLALWLGLCSAVLLCTLRSAVHRLPLLLGALSAWAIPTVVAFLGALLVRGLDLDLLGVDKASLSPLTFATRVAGIAALLSAALLRYFFVQEQWARQLQAHARAEVDALQARIRPHFLFNSMNTIASLVRHDPQTAERVVEDLSDLFRAALGGGPEHWPLADELRLCRRYLDIEALRLGARLSIAWDVPEDLPDVQVPRLLLQPLVENAVVHGVARLPAGGEITLRAQTLHGRLRVEIRNPVGADVASVGNRHASDSVRQRLAYKFGDRARMSVAAGEGYYSCVIELPAGD